MWGFSNCVCLEGDWTMANKQRFQGFIRQMENKILHPNLPFEGKHYYQDGYFITPQMIVKADDVSDFLQQLDTPPDDLNPNRFVTKNNRHGSVYSVAPWYDAICDSVVDEDFDSSKGTVDRQSRKNRDIKVTIQVGNNETIDIHPHYILSTIPFMAANMNKDKRYKGEGAFKRELTASLVGENKNALQIMDVTKTTVVILFLDSLV